MKASVNVYSETHHASGRTAPTWVGASLLVAFLLSALTAHPSGVVELVEPEGAATRQRQVEGFFLDETTTAAGTTFEIVRPAGGNGLFRRQRALFKSTSPDFDLRAGLEGIFSYFLKTTLVCPQPSAFNGPAENLMDGMAATALRGSEVVELSLNTWVHAALNASVNYLREHNDRWASWSREKDRFTSFNSVDIGVEYEQLSASERIAILTLPGFSFPTGALEGLVRTLRDQGVRRVGVNVSGNKGGSIYDLARFLSLFHRRDETGDDLFYYKTARGHDYFDNRSLTVDQYAITSGEPFELLFTEIDRKTASAAEWFAFVGAERFGAAIVGSEQEWHTFGKLVGQRARHWLLTKPAPGGSPGPIISIDTIPEQLAEHTARGAKHLGNSYSSVFYLAPKKSTPFEALPHGSGVQATILAPHTDQRRAAAIEYAKSKAPRAF